MIAIYKILGEADWRAAKRTGAVPQADVDRRDGFIHLSAEDQVLETARLYFAGRDDLIAAAFRAEDFGEALKWEASRGGALFPHLYADLPAAKATRALRLEPDGEGFRFGEEIL
ncbi:MAG TPA: DUF952 domain-containing protein [Parvularculaceae bacterium]|nr:DUF952 domain-containing protein [Parvularculaceae bacterium]